MTTQKSVPEAPPSFEDLTPEAVLTQTTAILTNTSTLHEHLAATLTPAVASFVNVVRPIIDDANRAACRLVILGELLSQLSPNPEVRQAAHRVDSLTAAAQTRNLMRRDVAALVVAAYARETSTASGNLDSQDRHLLSAVYVEYVSSGASLHSDAERERLRVASEELGEVCTAAQDTFIEPEEGIWFERAELVGIPDALLATMLEDSGRFQVTFRKDHVAAVMCHADSVDTRRRFTVANWYRLPENVARLAKAVALRDEIARLLGFEHHAALRMENRMARSVPYVEAQLEDLHKRLKPVAQAETYRLLELKKKASAENEDSIGELYEWDKAYYISKQKKDNFSVDHSLLAEYFEARHTLNGMLTLFHDLFGMEFELFITSAWHESVVSYQVWDTASEGGQFLGYLYVDLFERDGKYRGAHCIAIQPGFVEETGRRHYPATALICCYANPSQSRPTLLQHKEVTTMFHELGHAIHNLVTRTKYSRARSRDYSEIPSMMLENWTWVPDVLVRIGRHYTVLGDENKTRGALPRDLAEAVSRTRNPNRANAILAQIWPAIFDLAIHTPPTHEAALDMNTTEVWNQTKRRILTTSSGHDPRDWGAGQARFVHMFRHNDAGYFSYPLSIAYAADLFASAFARDPMSPVAGRKWRYQVLELGSSCHEMDILTGFLGREPSTKAILDELKA